MTISAVQHIRRMRGGAQSHLMRCSDGNLYIVKFQNNPQGVRVLANEMLATRLAESVGLPVPPSEVVFVEEWLVKSTRELNIRLAHGNVACASGLQFGSRYIADPSDGQVLDYMPVEMLERVRNLAAFAGMLAFDKWTGNIDGRQAAFLRKRHERNYAAVFIDQGYCFNAESWTFPDNPLRGIFGHPEVYAPIQGWQSFEPWLARIEGMPPDRIFSIADEIPPEWYGSDRIGLRRLGEELVARRELVRGLVEIMRMSPRRPFPLWSPVSSTRMIDASFV